MLSERGKALSTLSGNTIGFTVCFAVWVIFAVIGIPIKDELGLSDSEFGLLAATPILTGSLFRLPLGMLTDKYGGKIVFFALMCAVIPPLYLISLAHQFWHLVLVGLAVGICGASFSVGIAYTARWFPKNQQGFAMGIFGAGNAGAAVTKFVAPTLVVWWGWESVPQIYAIALAATAAIFWMLTYTDRSHRVVSQVSLRQQFAILKDVRVLRYCQYYSIVFGGFVALSLWMTKYYISEYGFDIQTAALLASIFVLPSGVIRALGGWLSDKYGAYTVTWWVMWVCWVCLFIMSYPQTSLSVTTTHGPLAFDIKLNVWFFTFLLFIVGIAWGLGKASIFKFISDDFSDNIGAVSGMVGLAGGMGGFLLPIMFGMILDLTGVNSSVFMLLYGVTCVSLVSMHFQYKGEKRKQAIPPLKPAEPLKASAQ